MTVRSSAAMLGLCPALAVTNNVENSLAMGIATLFVICGSSLLVSLCKRFIPGEIRRRVEKVENRIDSGIESDQLGQANRLTSEFSA